MIVEDGDYQKLFGERVRKLRQNAGWSQEEFAFRPIPAAARAVSSRAALKTLILEGSYDIRTVQELLGRKEVSTTMIYNYVPRRLGIAVQTPSEQGQNTARVRRE